MKLPQYSGKDYVIMFWTMIPFTVLLNAIVFGARLFENLSYFLVATLVTFTFMSVAFVLYGGVAVAFRNRFPKDEQFLKRTAMVILLFIIMTGLIIFALLKLLESVKFLNYTFSESRYLLAYTATAVLNVFLTILHEGVSRFERYKITLVETERLKKEYMQSQLLGLKSQVNPHFLFNSLNSLSSLIHENPDDAENFLNEMSRVYRYLLRNNEEKVVDLDAELHFINSYYNILKARYGDGIQLETNISPEHHAMLIPPLTLQILFEHAFNQSAISKEHPLLINIYSLNNDWLAIKSNVQHRIGGTTTENNNAGLENIVNKFQLLCRKNVLIHENETHRIIRLPLIHQPEMSVA